MEENRTAWGLPSSARLLHDLRQAGIPATMAWIPLQSALHWLVVTVPRDWRRRSGVGESEALCRPIGQTVFASKAGAVLPKVIVLNDDVDPTDLGHAVFDEIEAAPLLAYLRRSERVSGHTGKIVYNCLAPDEWGEALPMRASFRHGYPADIVDRVRRRWSEYGFKK